MVIVEGFNPPHPPSPPHPNNPNHVHHSQIHYPRPKHPQNNHYYHHHHKHHHHHHHPNQGIYYWGGVSIVTGKVGEGVQQGEGCGVGGRLGGVFGLYITSV